MLSTLLYDVEIRWENFSIHILKTEDACGGNLEEKSPKAMITKDMLDPEAPMATGEQVGGRESQWRQGYVPLTRSRETLDVSRWKIFYFI